MMIAAAIQTCAKNQACASTNLVSLLHPARSFVAMAVAVVKRSFAQSMDFAGPAAPWKSVQANDLQGIFCRWRRSRLASGDDKADVSSVDHLVGGHGHHHRRGL
jgi:UDP-2,3-diacylglucosamine pyrophosphatase LpxH